MTPEENKKKCFYCEDIFKGCACKIKKADDGNFVHGTCLDKYNYILKQKKQYNGRK